MARETKLVCDVCKKPTERIVAKLFFTPAIPGVTKKVHSDYTHSCDVGECCKNRLLRSFNFRRRRTARQYHDARKNGSS